MSRRRVIITLAAIPALVGGVRPLAVTAQSIAALEVEYRYRNRPNGRRKCWDCASYTRRTRVLGDCSLLQTTVTWEGYCSAWRLKAQ